MSNLGKAAKDGASIAAGKMLARVFGTTGEGKPKRPYTLLLKLHLSAHSKREIGTIFDKVIAKLKAMEGEGGDVAGMARGFITSFFGITEDIDIIRVADGSVKAGHL